MTLSWCSRHTFWPFCLRTIHVLSTIQWSNVPVIGYLTRFTVHSIECGCKCRPQTTVHAEFYTLRWLEQGDWLNHKFTHCPSLPFAHHYCTRHCGCNSDEQMAKTGNLWTCGFTTTTTTILRHSGFCLGLTGLDSTGKVKPGRQNQSEFTGARDSERQWHQLCHMQICTLTQTHSHANFAPLSFLQAGCPSCRQINNSVKAVKVTLSYTLSYTSWFDFILNG